MGQADSKLEFRKGVFRLFEEKAISPAEDAFWSQFWTLPDSAEDVFALVGASEIRKIRDSAPENLFTLVDKLVSTLTALVRQREFSPANRPTRLLLNCVRVLTRIMPFIFESEDANGALRRFFWDPLPSGICGTSTRADKAVQSESESTESSGNSRVPPRAEHMLQAVVEALFLPGLTVPARTGRVNETRPYTVWEAGIGSSREIDVTSEMLSNRAEMLRLLLVLLSKTLYMNVASTLAGDNPWAEHMTVHAPKAQVLPMLCSMLNTAMRYDPDGWGLPYDHMLVTDHRETVVALSLQTLNALLDYHRAVGERPVQVGPLAPGSLSPSRASLDSTASERAAFAEPLSGGTSPSEREIPARKSSVTHEPSNLYRLYLGKIFKNPDLAFLFQGMHRILSNPMKASNTLLPGSRKRVNVHQETAMLFWRLTELNKKFATAIMESGQVLDIAVLLLHYQMENQANNTQLGLVRMCAFILHSLSTDRRFAIGLNTKYNGNATLPPTLRLPAFSGSYADFLIITIHAIISKTQNKLAELHPTYLTVISNVSPYLKNVSVVSSNKLVQLFAVFSSPRMLLADEESHLLLRYILEPFDYIIRYQLTDNPHLVYAILRAQKRFEAIASFTLETALESVRRAEAKSSDAGSQLEQKPAAPPSGTRDQDAQSGALSKGGSVASAHSDGGPAERAATAEGRSGEGSANYNRPADVPPAVPAVDKGKGRMREEVEQAAQQPARRTSGNAEIDTRRTSPTTRRRPGEFTPTEDWVLSWHSNLPLASIMAVIRTLRPRVEQYCAAKDYTTQEGVVQFLKNESTLGLIPAPPPAFPRKFAWSHPIRAWFSSYLWGVIFVGNRFPFGMWNGTRIALFAVKTKKRGKP